MRTFIVLLLVSCSLAQIPTRIPTDLERTAILELRSANDAAFLASPLNGWSLPIVEIDFNSTDFCSWSGIQCGTNGITQLILENITISTVPDSVYTNFVNLAIFRLGNNNINTKISSSFNIGSNRISVNRVDLGNNRIPGTIPSAICKSNIITLNLSFNQLNGTIPSNIGDMTSLWDLNLAYNSLTGSIPDSIGNIKQMDTLNLTRNYLTGSIPSSFVSLTQLKSVDLSYNSLSGPIPDLKFTTGLKTLLLQGNSFDGLVPTFLTTYTETVNFAGAIFRCPIPACAPGVNCVLKNVYCTCPCNATGGGTCIEGSLTCNCDAHRYGTFCDQECAGTINTPYGKVPCNGHGDCFNGPSGTGQCSCFPGYGGPNCSIPCPGAPNNTCSGYGTCNKDGKCECFGNKGGVNCFGCAAGWAGSTCQIQCRGGSDAPCSGNGACNDGILGDGNCNCYSGFEGSDCAVNIAEKSSSVNGWLVFGIIIIILFVFAVAAIILVVFLYFRTKRNYEELSNRALPRTELQDFTRDNADDKTKGYKEKKDAYKIPSI